MPGVIFIIKEVQNLTKNGGVQIVLILLVLSIVIMMSQRFSLAHIIKKMS